MYGSLEKKEGIKFVLKTYYNIINKRLLDRINDALT